LLLETVPIMFEFRNIIVELIRNPLPGHPGKYSSPTYEIPHSAEQAAVTGQAEMIA
jgi:hypothetical protein